MSEYVIVEQPSGAVDIAKVMADGSLEHPLTVINGTLMSFASGVPRRLKCAGCQIGDHCNGEDDSCYCECTEKAAV